MLPYGTYYPTSQQFIPITYTKYQNLSSACKNNPAFLWVIQPDTAICPVIGETLKPASFVSPNVFSISPKSKIVEE